MFIISYFDKIICFFSRILICISLYCYYSYIILDLLRYLCVLLSMSVRPSVNPQVSLYLNGRIVIFSAANEDRLLKFLFKIPITCGHVLHCFVRLSVGQA